MSIEGFVGSRRGARYPSPMPSVNAEFEQTHWSVVLAAGSDDTKRSGEALAELCQTYWLPLYSFVRRRGYSPHDAQDLTQDFYPARGRFRSFLLANLKNFLANEWDRALAQKRGGGAVVLSLDADSAETFFGREPADTITPDAIFDRHCALILMDRALEKLEHENSDRSAQFARLKEFLTNPPPTGGYDAIGVELNLTPGTVAVAVHRLRARFRHLLRAEVAQTVATTSEVDDELRHLCQSL
jgi:DNA-directed RNA polymerase specialized sigma24 family protein